MSKFGETPKFDQRSLCEMCRCAQVTSGLRYDDRRVLCRLNGQIPVQMPQPILMCSDYDDKSRPPLWEMEKIAYRFSVDLRRKQAGFINPVEFRQRVKSGIELDD